MSLPTAHGRIVVPPYKNKAEGLFGGLLDYRKRLGLILWWGYEAVTLKLGQDCRYTPDFAVMNANSEFVFYEVKGFRRDDAIVKLKTAASMFPFRFFLVTKGTETEVKV